MIPRTPPGWVATQATVTSCHYQARALSALAVGFRMGEKFRIGFNYRAHGSLFSGTFDSPVAVPQNQRIPISYNPFAPEQNNRGSGSTSRSGTQSSLIPVSIAAAVVLSLAWVTVLHGCGPH